MTSSYLTPTMMMIANRCHSRLPRPAGDSGRMSTCAMLVCAVALTLVLCCQTAMCDEHTHRYAKAEEVVLWMNNVGPRKNRQESYAYFSLPFCTPPNSTISHYHETISERILGVNLEFSGLKITFKENKPLTQACSQVLSNEDARKFRYAIENDYWYEMFVDDLPCTAPVGEVDDGVAFIYQRKTVYLSYNQDRIIEVNVSVADRSKVESGSTLTFQYEGFWSESSIDFNDRFDKYMDADFFQHRVHWFSIFNSFMMVVFMVGLVSLILSRTLKKDMARYSKEDEYLDLEKSIVDEYGWKQIHGDVFRTPSYPAVLASLIGSGTQIAVSAFFCIFFAIIRELYTERASLLSTCIVLYSTTAPLNGYIGGSIYSSWRGTKWIRQLMIAVMLNPSLLFSTSFLVNLVAVYYGATRAISMGIAVSVLAILFFAVLPLHLIGTIVGRATRGDMTLPCRVNPVPKPIPENKWYMAPWVLSLAGGLLPFGSVFIEMYFIFTSFWAYKVYYVYGFMLLVFLMLCIVTVSIAIVCTYVLLNAEDHRWQWMSFMSGASISIYVYIYAIYYFIVKTQMYGLFQTSFYFGYMAVFCCLLGIMCGTMANIGASVFVYKIYSTIKVD